MEIKFYDSGQVDDHLLRFAVIVSRHGNKWLLVKHRERDTLEVPGGHREPGEDIGDTARRELWEETGATGYDIRPVCPYSVAKSGDDTASTESFGMLYYAEIHELSPIPDTSEIESVHLYDELPRNMTYPLIQPALTRRIEALPATWQT